MANLDALRALGEVFSTLAVDDEEAETEDGEAEA